MKKIIILLLIIKTCNAQKSVDFDRTDDFLGNGTFLYNDSFSNLKMNIYSPEIKIQKKYKKMENVKNQTPEELVLSIVSANTQEWIDFNTWGGAAESVKVPEDILKGISTSDIEKNYVLISSSIDFNANDEQYIILRIKIISEELSKPILGTYLLKKDKDRWYKTSNAWATDLTILFLAFQEEKLYSILNGKKTGEPLMDSLIEKVYQDNVLDMNTLFSIFDSWYTKPNVKMKEYFLDNKAWTY